jgi:hypothetical protein
MICDGCPDANRKVLVKPVGEHVLPRRRREDFGGRVLR